MDRNGYLPKDATPGRMEVDFIFKTNGASNPATTNFDGAVSYIKSVTHTGGNQDYVITLADSVVRVDYADAVVESTDGHWLSLKSVQNEASSSSKPIVTFLVWAANGTAANDYTAGQKIRVKLSLKISTAAG